MDEAASAPTLAHKGVETEVLAARLHRLLALVLHRAPTPDRTEAESAAAAMQHVIDDLVVINFAAHAERAATAARENPPVSSSSTSLHPAWRTFLM